MSVVTLRSYADGQLTVKLVEAGGDKSCMGHVADVWAILDGIVERAQNATEYVS